MTIVRSMSPVSRRYFLLSTGVAAASLALPVRAFAKELGFADWAKSPIFDAWVRAKMEQGHVPGLSLGIIEGGKLIRTAAYGWANVEQRRPMQVDTLLNIASVTKTITCTALMQLWERKKFALDDDVNAHLPFKVRHPAHADIPITVRQLMMHTSSIDDAPAYEMSYACGDSQISLGAWLRDYFTAGSSIYDPKANFHAWAPGQFYSYSNVAYGLVGHLIEVLSGMSYADYCVQHVFAPLGMRNSRYLLAGTDPKAHATPYTYVADGKFSAVRLREPSWSEPASVPALAQVQDGVWVPHCQYSFATPPDGGARTSAQELSRLILAYLHGGRLNGTQILQPQTVARILTDQHVSRPPSAGAGKQEDGQGLTWALRRQYGPDPVWGHTGGDPGVSTLVALRPKDRRGIVIIGQASAKPNVAGQIATRIFAAPQ